MRTPAVGRSRIGASWPWIFRLILSTLILGLLGIAPRFGSFSENLPGPRSIQRAQAQVSLFHVAAGGSDSEGEGSEAKPWASIGHALGRVPDEPGVIILVGDGDYPEDKEWSSRFASPVTIRAANRYRARIKATRPIEVSGRGIILGGLEFLGEQPADDPARRALLYISGEEIRVTDCIFRDPSFGDQIEIGGGARAVSIENSLIADPRAGHDGIRVSESSGLRIAGNVFYSSDGPGGSGDAESRATDRALLHVGAAARAGEEGPGTGRDLQIERNIFVNASDNPGRAMIELGAGPGEPTALDLVIENNLFLGTEGNRVLALIGLWGSRGLKLRANTFVGDFPSRAFLLHAAWDNRELEIHNNILADPSGTMGPIAAWTSEALPSIGNNLYWNAGQGIFEAGPVRPGLDPAAVLGDPRLPDPGKLDLGAIPFGEEPLTESFGRLSQLAATGEGSAAIDRADGRQMPLLDLSGRPRGVPDIGALEHRALALATPVLATPSPVPPTPTVPIRPTDPAFEARAWIHLPLAFREAGLEGRGLPALASPLRIRYKWTLPEE